MEEKKGKRSGAQKGTLFTERPFVQLVLGKRACPHSVIPQGPRRKGKKWRDMVGMKGEDRFFVRRKKLGKKSLNTSSKQCGGQSEASH